MNFTGDMNTGRNIFVFGSNEQGMHGGGAAREAHVNWGAKMAVGFGRTGQSFAIPTIDWEFKVLPLPIIKNYVDRFIAYAHTLPELTFLVTKIGCGIAGHAEVDIAPMFRGAPGNCVLPEGWGR